MDSKFDQSGREIQGMGIANRYSAYVERTERSFRLQGREEDRNVSWSDRMTELVIDTYIEAFEACRGRMIEQKGQECSTANTPAISQVQVLQASMWADRS